MGSGVVLGKLGLQRCTLAAGIHQAANALILLMLRSPPLLLLPPPLLPMLLLLLRQGTSRLIPTALWACKERPGCCTMATPKLRVWQTWTRWRQKAA